MTRYTVVHARLVETELADLWLASADPGAITQASNQIDAELLYDADCKGEVVRGQLRMLEVLPLWAYYTVQPDDRLVTLWSVRLAHS